MFPVAAAIAPLLMMSGVIAGMAQALLALVTDEGAQSSTFVGVPPTFWL
jgi:hypothetical protein